MQNNHTKRKNHASTLLMALSAACLVAACGGGSGTATDTTAASTTPTPAPATSTTPTPSATPTATPTPGAAPTPAATPTPTSVYRLVGSYDKTECVFDSSTGLTWEGKPATGFRANTNTFTNYDNTTTLQIRIPGVTDTFAMPTLAEVNAATNSIGYAAAVNAAALCGYTNWRMPTKAELLTINIVANGGLGTNGSGFGLDGDVTAWFPNTINGMTWTSTPFQNGVEDGANMVSFGGSGHFGWGRKSPLKVRLVR
jgi:hypothetical protein